MNPNAGRVATLNNTTATDFTHSWDGTAYSVKSGESIALPYDIAVHLAKHLARREMLTTPQANNNSSTDNLPAWNDEQEERKAFSYLTGITGVTERIEKTETEILAERIAALEAFRTGEPAPATVSLIDADASDPQNVQDGFDIRSKADVIEELRKRDIPFDARKSRADLEALLN